MHYAERLASHGHLSRAPEALTRQPAPLLTPELCTVLQSKCPGQLEDDKELELHVDGAKQLEVSQEVTEAAMVAHLPKQAMRDLAGHRDEHFQVLLKNGAVKEVANAASVFLNEELDPEVARWWNPGEGVAPLKPGTTTDLRPFKGRPLLLHVVATKIGLLQHRTEHPHPTAQTTASFF